MSRSTTHQKLSHVLEQALREERSFYHCNLENVSLRPGEITIRPVVDRREQSARTVSLHDSVQDQLFHWLAHPFHMLEGRISPATHQSVIDEQLRHALSQPITKRSLPESIRLYMLNGEAVGILPAKLHAASNEQFLDCFLQAARREGISLEDAEVRWSEIDHGSLDIKATFPSFVSEPRVGDIVHFGLSLKHSSVGCFPSDVSFYAYRMACSNGLLAPICLDPNRQKNRIRRGSQERLEKTLGSIQKMVQHACRNFPARMAAFKQLSSQKINVRNVIDELITVNRWSRYVKGELIDAIDRGEHGGEETAFGVVNRLSYLGTHGPQRQGRRIPQSVLNRLQLVSGVYAGQGVHQCPNCRRILTPSTN